MVILEKFRKNIYFRWFSVCNLEVSSVFILHYHRTSLDAICYNYRLKGYFFFYLVSGVIKRVSCFCYLWLYLICISRITLKKMLNNCGLNLFTEFFLFITLICTYNVLITAEMFFFYLWHTSYPNDFLMNKKFQLSDSRWVSQWYDLSTK